jgi:hypothetical protein
VTLLEVSFVFLPCLMQVPLAWGEDSSSEQHSFVKLPMLLPLGARKEISREHISRASSSEHSRASSSSSGVQQQWHAAASAYISSCEQQQQRLATIWCKLANQA